MHGKFGAGRGAAPNAGKEQLHPARTHRSAGRDVHGDALTPHHPRQRKIGAIVTRARAFDHVDLAQCRKCTKQGSKLGRRIAFDAADQFRPVGGDHVERAETCQWTAARCYFANDGCNRPLSRRSAGIF